MKLSQERQPVVTPQMIRAGVDALDGFNQDLDSALETVAEVYRAMEIERRRGLEKSDMTTLQRKTDYLMRHGEMFSISGSKPPDQKRDFP